MSEEFITYKQLLSMLLGLAGFLSAGFTIFYRLLTNTTAKLIKEEQLIHEKESAIRINALIRDVENVQKEGANIKYNYLDRFRQQEKILTDGINRISVELTAVSAKVNYLAETVNKIEQKLEGRSI